MSDCGAKIVLTTIQTYLVGGEGNSNMKVMGMCLPENKNGAFGVGFHRKNVVNGCGIQKNWAFFGVNFQK